MKKKYLYILIIILLGITVLGFVIYKNVNKDFLASNNISYTTNATSSMPLILTIPKINLRANIDPVGVTKDGSMDVPKSLADVGWYKFGVVPGEKGAAVLDGHQIDNIRNRKLIFSRLNELVVGDNIYVLNDRGENIHFKVIDKKLLDYDIKDTSALFASSTTSKLNLITCDGEWIQSVKNYDKRLVVFAEIVIK